MAERIFQDVTPPKIGSDAHEELEALLQTLHEHGVLRFTNDVVAAKTEIAKILVSGLNKEGSLNAVQNISVIAMVLAAIPPDRFYQVMVAIKEGINQMSNYPRDSENAPDSSKGEAPGLSGVYKLLHDEELWDSIQPLLAGLKAFFERLDQPIDKPVTDFTGKPTEGA